MFQMCYHNLCQQLPTAFLGVNPDLFNNRAFPVMIWQLQVHSAKRLSSADTGYCCMPVSLAVPDCSQAHLIRQVNTDLHYLNYIWSTCNLPKNDSAVLQYVSKSQKFPT